MEYVSTANETVLSMRTIHLGYQHLDPMLVSYLSCELSLPASAQADGRHLLVHGVEQTRGSWGGGEA
jgi:hypothetical protein